MIKWDSPVVIFTIIYTRLQRCPLTLSFTQSINFISIHLDDFGNYFSMWMKRLRKQLWYCNRIKNYSLQYQKRNLDTYMWACIGGDHRWVTLVIRNKVSSNALCSLQTIMWAKALERTRYSQMSLISSFKVHHLSVMEVTLPFGNCDNHLCTTPHQQDHVASWSAQDPT